MTDLLPRKSQTTVLGAEEIERQHERLVAIMGELERRDAARASKQELSGLLELLFDCTLEHFEAEEAFMARTAYPKLDTHSIIHRSLLAALSEHRARFDAGDGRLGNRLLSFMKYWLIAHFNSVDLLHVAFCEQRSACM